MMKEKKAWVVFVVFCIGFSGCTKKEQPADESEQIVEVTSPEKAPQSDDGPVGEAKAAPSPYQVLPTLGATGALEGQVKFMGDAPKNKPVAIPQSIRESNPDDFVFCESKNVKQDQIQVLAGGVANVVVQIKGIAAGKAHLQPGALQVEHCRVSPRVSLLPIGARLTISNADPFAFSFSMAKADETIFWNQEILPDTKASSPGVESAEEFVLSNSLRPWMKAFVRTVPHPYFAVSDLSGRFRIDEVPVGKYEVSAWHEVFGKREGSVEISEGGISKLELSYGP